MNSEERRDELFQMLAGADYAAEHAREDREVIMSHLSPDEREKKRGEQILTSVQRYADAEECLLQALGKEGQEQYLAAKSKLLWEHGKGID